MQKVLDLSPVRPPAIAMRPRGRSLDFNEVVLAAGMKNVVSGAKVDIRIHGGTRDMKVPQRGRAVYCLAGPTLPQDPGARAREILRRLAYGFGDYAAREIVGRYHRDLRRQARAKPADEEAARVARRALARSALKVRHALRTNPDLSIGELAEATGMAQPNVSRAVSALVEAGVVEVRRDGKRVLCRMTIM